MGPTVIRGTLRQAWHRLDSDRVEIACGGGRGRTGTALACLVVMDAGPAVDPVAYVRDHYDARAVETPWPHRYVARFSQRRSFPDSPSG